MKTVTRIGLGLGLDPRMENVAIVPTTLICQFLESGSYYDFFVLNDQRFIEHVLGQLCCLRQCELARSSYLQVLVMVHHYSRKLCFAFIWISILCATGHCQQQFLTKTQGDTNTLVITLSVVGPIGTVGLYLCCCLFIIVCQDQNIMMNEGINISLQGMHKLTWFSQQLNNIPITINIALCHMTLRFCMRPTTQVAGSRLWFTAIVTDRLYKELGKQLKLDKRSILKTQLHT